MAFERHLPEQTSIAWTADGTTLGKITIPKPWLFKVLQVVVIESGTQPSQEVQVKRVEDTFLFVGPHDHNLTTRLDISAYTVGDGASLRATEQNRPFIVDEQPYTVDDLEHEEEPTNAKRAILVDPAGRKIDSVLSGSPPVRRLAVDVFPTSGGGGSTPIVPTTPAITNLPMALAGTEYSLALPADTKRFLVRLRQPTSANLRIAFSPGATSTSWLTAPVGCVFSEADVEVTGLTLYLQADQASQVAEILVWTGGGASTNPTLPTIANITLAVANTEQSYIFPALTKRFLIRSRGGFPFQIAFTTGQSGTNFVSISAGAVFTEADADLNGVVFQSPVAGDILEILSWA